MKSSVDTTNFDGMVSDLSRMSGKPRLVALKNQVGRVLETAIKYTPIASIESITKGVMSKHPENLRFKEGNDVIVVNKKSKRIWFSEKGGEKPWYLMKGIIGGHTWKFSDTKYNRFLAVEQERQANLKIARREISANNKGRRADLAAKKKARGLARRSWVEIASALGITVKANPKQVFSAKPSNGKIYQNGTARTWMNGQSVFIYITNQFPAFLKAIDGNGILQRAIKTRISAFKIEVKKGVFDDIEMRAKRYPGIFVS